jgi:hypothetical protein
MGYPSFKNDRVEELLGRKEQTPIFSGELILPDVFRELAAMAGSRKVHPLIFIIVPQIKEGVSPPCSMVPATAHGSIEICMVSSA